MTYRDAKKLHNEDEVIRKSDGAVLRVVAVDDYPKVKTISILCDDGNAYHHREVK